ncbi:MAG TPA: ImmA/IrrE family metallo-endopeptidase [Aldersonia sp.]
MSAETEGRAAAEKFRKAHRLGIQPLGDLVALIEQTTGNDVAVLGVGPDEHGLTMRDPFRDAVFIAVARTSHPMRQRSTLAHELAHVVFADWTAVPSVAPVSARPFEEIRADAFARHLLVPVAGLQEVVDAGRPVDLGALSKVVQLFGVSPAMAAIALHDADRIDSETKQRWMTLMTPGLAARFGWSDQYESLQVQSNSRRAPQKLLARSIHGYVENVVSAQTIATLRSMDVEDVIRALHGEGIRPRELN